MHVNGHLFPPLELRTTAWKHESFEERWPQKSPAVGSRLVSLRVTADRDSHVGSGAGWPGTSVGLGEGNTPGTPQNETWEKWEVVPDMLGNFSDDNGVKGSSPTATLLFKSRTLKLTNVQLQTVHFPIAWAQIFQVDVGKLGHGWELSGARVIMTSDFRVSGTFLRELQIVTN